MPDDHRIFVTHTPATKYVSTLTNYTCVCGWNYRFNSIMGPHYHQLSEINHHFEAVEHIVTDYTSSGKIYPRSR